MKKNISKTRIISASVKIALGLLLVIATGGAARANVATGEAAFNRGDFVTATREFQGPAYRGDTLARYYLAVIYADGLGTERNYEESLAWLLCVPKGSGLPPALGSEIEQKRSHILARISPYALEQAQMRAASICGFAIPDKPQPFAKEERNPEDIRPARGFWGGLFFFPSDTMFMGAAVVFHELGLTLLEDLLFGLTALLGDLIFGLFALLGWFMVGWILRFFFEPIWGMILARNQLAEDMSGSGEGHGQVRESESD